MQMMRKGAIKGLLWALGINVFLWIGMIRYSEPIALSPFLLVSGAVIGGVVGAIRRASP
jgi:hypothetical protein